jgi:exopolysaccharide biosynthesis protein
MKKSETKKKYIILLSALIIFTIVYLLANRYLIDHVEVVVESNNFQSDSEIEDAVYDDLSYKSSLSEINIKEVQTGSGNNIITYFVADLKINKASNLLSAFAENKFGTNITEDTSVIAENNNAVFAINGDYYGFREDGIVIRNGELYRDEPARTGLAIYEDGNLEIYDEEETSGEELLNNGVINTLSFGPALIENGNVVTDFDNVKIDKNFGNRSIQNSNPRTAIGMIEENHFVFVVVDGRSENYSNGMTLEELALLFSDLGCEEAYNLDGGGSSTMYFNGEVVNNPLGKNRERGVSDILYIAG